MACVAPAALCRVRLKIGNDLYCNGPGWHKGGRQPIVSRRAMAMEWLFKSFAASFASRLSLALRNFLICMPGLPGRYPSVLCLHQLGLY